MLCQDKNCFFILCFIAVIMTVGCNIDFSDDSDRPAGWTDETHGDKAESNYDVVFAQNIVERIDLIIKPRDWKYMLDDMTELCGKFGQDDTMPSEGPPEELIEACDGLQEGALCQANIYGQDIEGSCFLIPINGGQLFCNPDNMQDVPVDGEIPGDIQNGTEEEEIPFGKMIERDPVYRPCSFVFEDKTWWHVGVRFKGNSTLKKTWEDGSMKLPLRFDFDKFEDDYPEIKNQRFFGFKELALSNNAFDSSMLREKIGADVFREAGVPASQTAFYRLFIDYGKGPIYFGLYTMTEVPDEPMLATQFRSKGGNLYKPEGPGAKWVEFDEDSFEKRTNKSEEDWSDITAAFYALHADRSDPILWRSGLEKAFSVNGFLLWLAVNTVIQNWDTYGNMPHNYYLYSDLDDGLLHWIPWDNNMAFMSQDFFILMAPHSMDLSGVDESWPLIRYLMDDPVYRHSYLFFVNEVIEGVLDVDRIWKRFQSAHDLIASYVVGPEGEQPGYTTLRAPDNFYSELEYLLEHIAQRNAVARQFLTDEQFVPYPVVINEIHYNPASSQGEDYEFIELVNTGGEAVDLSGYAFSKAVEFAFPQNTVIAANEYIIISKNADAFNSQQFQFFEWDSGKLSNKGEVLQLNDSKGFIVDYVKYDDKRYWPSEADGNGASLELQHPGHVNSFYENWKASKVSGGTPGDVNSVYDLFTHTVLIKY